MVIRQDANQVSYTPENPAEWIERDGLWDLEPELVNAEGLDSLLETLPRNTELCSRARGSSNLATSVGQRAFNYFSFPFHEHCGEQNGSPGTSSRLSSTENVSPSHKMTARSTTFCNSRMLPGHS